MRITSAEFVRSAHEADQFPRDGLPQVAFVGRSNVGKSSLMNRLLGRKGLARTSSTPGRTRAVNLFLINRRFYFVDLPGYGYAKAGRGERQRWAGLVESYLRHTASEASAVRPHVVQLVDAKVGATDLDAQALDYLLSFDATVTVVATKVDKLRRGRLKSAMDEIRRTLGLPEGVDPLPVSAKTGDGVKELWNAISVRL